MSLRSFAFWAFRISVVLSVASIAALVLYFTPLPDLYFASCDRPCHELDWPMICRYRLVLESHYSMGAWCGECPQNVSHCHEPGCILGDGTAKKVYTANKMLPGPSIQVCENDILVVDVVNRLPGQGVAVHWRGQPQRESPYMDGVPMVTQCPISSYTTFQYKFRASKAGTHIWHAHTGNEMVDGLFGSLIVRKADRIEEMRQLYDKDEKSHILMLSEWESSILINGVSSHKAELLPRFVIHQGLRYRFRVAHAGDIECPLYLHIDGHELTIISLDGNHIEPVITNAFRIAQGERLDFVLTASNEANTYRIRVESNCTKSFGEAKLVYNNTVTDQLKGNTHRMQSFKTTKLLSTISDADCHSKNSMELVCLNQLKSLKKLPPPLNKKNADMTLFLPFDYVVLASSASGIRELRPRLNNITFLFPPSPLLSQGEGSEGVVCTGENIKDEESSQHCNPSKALCECTHVINIPLHSVVEIVLVNQDLTSENGEHVFHLHGQSFYVTSVSNDIPQSNIEHLKKLNSKGLLLKRNLLNPVMKDTISVPRGGAAALRFKASNPGYWLLHEQSSADWARGLDVVLKVGEREDFQPTPENFPKCGSWVGPEFFLI